MLNENFYISLKKFFKDQNITQQQVADKLGTSQAYVNSILIGRNPIGRQTASRLAAAYGLSAAWLLTGEGEMLSSSHGSVNHISMDAGSRINATGGSSVSNVGNVAQGSRQTAHNAVVHSARIVIRRRGNFRKHSIQFLFSAHKSLMLKIQTIMPLRRTSLHAQRYKKNLESIQVYL